VRHAIATEKWLEAEHMKSLSAREKQRHMLEKTAADKMRTNSLSGLINGTDGDRENGGARQNDNDYELSGIDGRHGSSNGQSSSSSSSSSSSGFNYDPMGDIPYEVEEEDDTDDDESDELSHVPSITELAAEVAVLSNPYKDKFNFNPVNNADQEMKLSAQKEVEISDGGKKKGKKSVTDSAIGLPNSSSMASSFSSSSSSSKPAVKRAPPKLKHQVDSEHNTKAGLRAEHGDYTGLLVNGLFTSSVLRTGSYYKSKEINIIKVI
jgi:hypothetical protein